MLHTVGQDRGVEATLYIVNNRNARRCIKAHVGCWTSALVQRGNLVCARNMRAQLHVVPKMLVLAAAASNESGSQWAPDLHIQLLASRPG